MSVGRICTREVHLAFSQEFVTEAAERMAAKNVGCLVVLSESKRPIGIITDRDITLKVTAKKLDGHTIRISEVMTLHPRVILETTPIEEALSSMRKGAFRRLPVVDEQGYLVGLLSLDDVMNLLLEEFADVRELLKTQAAPLRHLS